MLVDLRPKGLNGKIASETLDKAAITVNKNGIPFDTAFGKDLATARGLNAVVAETFEEKDTYRIDHYLGKETAQNIMVLRFANSLFEPNWNSRYIDHVQITCAENLGMEGGRGGYYDTAGALRDMVQNHLFQLLTLVAMEPPTDLSADSVRDEKVKVIRALRPLVGPRPSAKTSSVPNTPPAASMACRAWATGRRIASIPSPRPSRTSRCES
jgi:glucose-6-phosphate 1-dehydrogenase